MYFPDQALIHYYSWWRSPRQHSRISRHYAIALLQPAGKNVPTSRNGSSPHKDNWPNIVLTLWLKSNFWPMSTAGHLWIGVLFALRLWRFVIYYLMQGFTHGFLLWIIRWLKFMSPSLCACCNPLTRIPFPPSLLPSLTKTSIFDTQLQKSPLQGGFYLLEAFAYHFSAFIHPRDNYWMPADCNHCARL